MALFRRNPGHLIQTMDRLGRQNRQLIFENFGFSLDIRPSRIEGAGHGVFVSNGRLKQGQIAALYPGTVYQPTQPVMYAVAADVFRLKSF